VSNACANLWNLPARCSKDQIRLLELDAVPMLRNLVNSKNRMISIGSVAALKNLSSLRIFREYDSLASSMQSSSASSNGRTSILRARKIPQFRPELDESLSEICDNTESPKMSPIHVRSSSSPQTKLNFPERIISPFTPPLFNSHQSIMSSSSSKDSLCSTHSEPIFSSTNSNLMTAGYRHLHDYLMSLRNQMEETKENDDDGDERNKLDTAYNLSDDSNDSTNIFHAYPIQIESEHSSPIFAHSKSSSDVSQHPQISNLNNSSVEDLILIFFQ